MATPGAPANVAVRPGHNPGDVIVEWDAVVASPTVDYYECYIHPQTGVDSTSAFKAKRLTTATRATFRNKQWREVYATVTATNSEATGADATEASGNVRL